MKGQPKIRINKLRTWQGEQYS